MQQEQETQSFDFEPITIQSDIAFLSSFLAAKPPLDLAWTQSPMQIPIKTKTPVKPQTPTNPTGTNRPTCKPSPTSTKQRQSRATEDERELVAGLSSGGAVRESNDRIEVIRLRRKRERGRMSRVLRDYQRETRERLWRTVPVREAV